MKKKEDDVSGIRRLGDGYEPHVDEAGGRLVYSIPVESGFVSTGFSFDISERDLAVLLSDPYRRAALEVIAHAVLQRSMLRGGARVTQPGFDALVAEVLHSPPAALEDTIARASREHNMIVSHYITQAMARRAGDRV
ncbi:hypothetical protein [Asticcacaulis solisilvae]|uniref:hypothetical protein n=1 Tax=Asticcacaulis solisilvae TaxID=1217274 RepID=UPI003FD80ABA